MRINHTCGVSMGHFTDTSLISSRDIFWNRGGGRRVKMTRQDAGALRRPQHGIKTRSGKVPRGRRTGSRPPAKLDLKPACLETAGGAPRDLAPNQQLPDQTKNPGTLTKTNETSARNGTRRSPMLTHETSPVLGASVVGMNNGACQGLTNMLAGVPGVSTALAREDRLRPKGRLR
jgi:hypothetical protein